MVVLDARVSPCNFAHHLVCLCLITLWASIGFWVEVAESTPQEGTADCSSSDTIEWSDHDGTVAKLAKVYENEQFDQLESSMECLLNPLKRFTSGRPGSSAIYGFFRMKMPGPGVESAEADRVARWARVFPNSKFVRYAQARFAYAMAWNIRGGNFARDVNEESWKGFHDGLRNAEQLLIQAPTELRNTPIAQHLLLAISQDAGQPNEARVALFREGIARWPQYYGLYENMLKRLVPKWGGSWGIVDQFIRTWSSQLSKEEGSSMYSRLYARVLLDGANVEETMIQWPIMKASLEDLVKRYPDSYNWSLAASSACLFRDVVFLKYSMQHLPPNQVQTSAWFKTTSPESCARLNR